MIDTKITEDYIGINGNVIVGNLTSNEDISGNILEKPCDNIE